MAHITGLMRLGQDAEIRYTPQGKAVCTLSLAYNYGRKENGGQRPSQWVEAALWEKRAEALAPYLKKGGVVYVVLSDVRIEQYEHKGEKRAKLVASVLDIELSGGRQESSDAGPASTQQPPARNSQAEALGFDDDMDIPF